MGGKLTKFRGHKEITENHESFYPRKFLAVYIYSIENGDLWATVWSVCYEQTCNMPNGINHTSFVLTETGGPRSSNSHVVSEVRMMLTCCRL